MVSRQETARPLLTPGEIMQLPPTDEIVMVSGVHPIRAKKARYFEDRRFTERVLPTPTPGAEEVAPKPDDWSGLPLPGLAVARPDRDAGARTSGTVHRSGESDDAANGGIRREPDLPDHEEIAPTKPGPAPEFTFRDEPEDDEAARAATLRRQMSGLAKQASLDPADGLGL
jgi:type IV secretion system protein VirD4